MTANGAGYRPRELTPFEKRYPEPEAQVILAPPPVTPLALPGSPLPPAPTAPPALRYDPPASYPTAPAPVWQPAYTDPPPFAQRLEIGDQAQDYITPDLQARGAFVHDLRPAQAERDGMSPEEHSGGPDLSAVSYLNGPSVTYWVDVKAQLQTYTGRRGLFFTINNSAFDYMRGFRDWKKVPDERMLFLFAMQWRATSYAGNLEHVWGHSKPDSSRPFRWISVADMTPLDLVFGPRIRPVAA